MTADRVFWNQNADEIVSPTNTGQWGALPKHGPLTPQHLSHAFAVKVPGLDKGSTRAQILPGLLTAGSKFCEGFASKFGGCPATDSKTARAGSLPRLVEMA